jgi:hypothetical protein
MRKFLLLLSLCLTVLLFTFNSSIKAWTLDDDLETFPVAEEDPPLPTQVFLPMISGNQTANSTAVVSSDTTWTRYKATYYSFLYPDERKVEEHNEGQYVRLSPSTDQKTDSKIEFAYLGFEIGEDEDLLEWYNKYTKAAVGEVPERIILARQSVTAPDGSIVRKLHEQHGLDDRVIQTISVNQLPIQVQPVIQIISHIYIFT